MEKTLKTLPLAQKNHFEPPVQGFERPKKPSKAVKFAEVEKHRPVRRVKRRSKTNTVNNGILEHRVFRTNNWMPLTLLPYYSRTIYVHKHLKLVIAMDLDGPGSA